MNLFLKTKELTQHEITRIKAAWSLRFMYQLGLVTAWTIITALFVEVFGIENILYLFGIEAFLYLISSFVVSFLYQKISLTKYTYLLAGGTLLFLIIAGIINAVMGSSILFFGSLLIAKSVFYTQLNIALYRRNEEIFSPSEAVRFIPLVESAVTIGSFIGAGLIVLSLYVFSEFQVLFLWGAGLVGVMAITYVLPSMQYMLPVLKKEEAEKGKHSFFQNIRSAIKLPFVICMIAFVGFQTAVFTSFDMSLTQKLQKEIAHHAHEEKEETMVHFENGIAQQLQASLVSDVKQKVEGVKDHAKEVIEEASTHYIMNETLAHDLGKFHLLFGFIALIFQLFITSSVVKKFGVVGSMVIFAGGLFLAGIGMVLGYMDIKWASSIRHGTHSIGETGYHVSFYSLYTYRRESIRLFLEGIVKPMGVLVAVLMLSIAPKSTITWMMPIFGLMILTIGMVMKKAYTQLSHHNMKHQQSLSAHLHAIEVMGQSGHNKSEDLLCEHLLNKKEHPLVRQKTIAMLTQLQEPSIMPTYIHILSDKKEPEAIKIHILDSMLQMKELKSYLKENAFSCFHLLQVLKKLLTTTKHDHIKKLLVMNIFKHMPTVEVVPFFLQNMENADEKLQSIYLRSCRVFQDPSLYHYIHKFLYCNNTRLQGYAIIALWNTGGNKKELRHILKELLSASDQSSVIAALYTIGEVEDKTFKNEIKSFLESEDEYIHLHACIALAKLGDKKTIPALAEIILNEEKSTSHMALEMIARIPQNLRQQVLHSMRHRVSSQVQEILCNAKHCHSAQGLHNISKKRLFSLRRLYELVGQFDDVAIIEKALLKA